MAKSGHHFPRDAGFSNSSGKTQSVRGYTRTVAKKANGGQMLQGLPGRALSSLKGRSPYVTSSPKTPPPGMNMQRPMPGGPRAIPMAPPMRIQPVRPGGPRAFASGGPVKTDYDTMKRETIGDQGNAVVLRGNPPIMEMDKEYGGRGSLRAGYAKGGKVVAGPEVAAKKAAGAAKAASTSSDVKSPTSTRTEVRSPTSTSTKADTRGNFTSTVTGGAGKGATSVTINVPGLSKSGQKYARGGQVGHGKGFNKSPLFGKK